jgi:lipopolysaccharide export system protein LptC
LRVTRRTGRTDGDRVFRAAARHSRFVRFLRVAIPATIVLIATTVIVAAFFNPFRLIAAFPIDPGKVSLSGTKIVMELPRMKGFTNDARPYEMTARLAAQDITKPEVLELTDVSGHVDMKDGQHMNISSVNGLYNTKSEVLNLSDRVVVIASTGYQAHLSEATVHTNTGYILSESPVEVKLPDGLLNANRLEVLENGDLLRFGGGVEMALDAPAQAADTPHPKAASTPPAPATTASIARRTTRQ